MNALVAALEKIASPAVEINGKHYAKKGSYSMDVAREALEAFGGEK